MTATHSTDSPDANLTFVGREREQAILRERLAAALAGHGGLALIGGEAGIGKTTLAEALLTEAEQRGALVLIGRCYDLGETPPYGPWADLFARATRDGQVSASPIDEGQDSGMGPAGQQVLFARVREALAAIPGPLVILLEDLHWADPASLDLLRFLGRDLDALPLLILATYRADEVVRRHPLYALLPALVREARATRLDLRALGETDLRTLLAARYTLPIADMDRLIAYLQERTEGNPFFSGELLRTLEDDGALRRDGLDWALADLAAIGVPTLLRQVIDARIDRLGEEARGLLAIAAALGQEVPLDLWLAVAGTGEDALLGLIERAAEARVLLPTAEGVRFAHALIREVLYEGVLPLRRRALHRRIADALLALPAPDPDAVAYHLQRAGDPRAPEWLVRAGERAWRSYAWLTAAERYEAALALTDHGGMDAGERARLLLMLAQLWRYQDRHRGVSYLEEAERLAIAAGDDALVAAARFDGGHLKQLASDARARTDRPAGLAAMAAALPALEALAPAERARLPALLLQGVGGEERYHRGALMYWLVWVGRLAEAMELAEPLVARGPGTNARSLAALGVAYFHLGRPDEAERILAESQASFQATGQQVEVFYRLIDRLRVAHTYHLDEPTRWQHLPTEVDKTIRRAASAGRMERGAALLNLQVTRGDWADARRRDEGFLFESWPQAIVARYQGDSATTLAMLDRSLPDGLATEPGTVSLLTALIFQQLAIDLALDANNLPMALAWLGAHDRWLAWSGSVWGQAEGQLGWAAYHRAAGDLVLAQQHAESAVSRASEPRQPLALLAAHRLLGELATADGRYPDAATSLAAALALADACAAPYERALTLLALVELHLATGDNNGARATLDEVHTILTPLEARPALARADALAARLATPTPASTTATPFGLSARETEVLRLVAEGLSDAQVADRLYLSPFTVKAHLRSIYGKLAVPSRAAATRLALEHGLV